MRRSEGLTVLFPIFSCDLQRISVSPAQQLQQGDLKIGVFFGGTSTNFCLKEKKKASWHLLRLSSFLFPSFIPSLHRASFFWLSPAAAAAMEAALIFFTRMRSVDGENGFDSFSQ